MHYYLKLYLHYKKGGLIADIMPTVRLTQFSSFLILYMRFYFGRQICYIYYKIDTLRTSSVCPVFDSDMIYVQETA